MFLKYSIEFLAMLRIACKPQMEWRKVLLH